MEEIYFYLYNNPIIILSMIKVTIIISNGIIINPIFSHLSKISSIIFYGDGITKFEIVTLSNFNNQ